MMPDGHWLVVPQVSTVDDLFGTHTLHRVLEPHRIGNLAPCEAEHNWHQEVYS